MEDQAGNAVETEEIKKKLNPGWGPKENKPFSEEVLGGGLQL